MIFKSIYSFIEKHQLIPDNTTIIVGLSGGPDSLFLLHLLASLRTKKNCTLIAAHLDHEWRQTSGHDAQFCRQVTHTLNVQFVTKKISELGLEIPRNGSKEEYARKMRRHFFSEVKKQYSGDLIALAHHAQDQQETFFIRLIRGTSLAGLTAMLPQKNDYIRPLLQINKTDILKYLNQHNITYLQDPSNDSHDFLRNRIRHLVVPALKEADARFEKNIATTITRLQDAHQFLDTISAQLFHAHSSYDNNRYYLHHTSLVKLDPIITYHILVHWLVKANVPFTPSQRFFDEIVRFLKQPGNKTHALHPLWTLVKNKQHTYIQSSN